MLEDLPSGSGEAASSPSSKSPSNGSQLSSTQTHPSARHVTSSNGFTWFPASKKVTPPPPPPPDDPPPPPPTNRASLNGAITYHRGDLIAVALARRIQNGEHVMEKGEVEAPTSSTKRNTANANYDNSKMRPDSKMHSNMAMTDEMKGNATAAAPKADAEGVHDNLKKCNNCNTSESSKWLPDPDTKKQLCVGCETYKRMFKRDKPTAFNLKKLALESKVSGNSSSAIIPPVSGPSMKAGDKPNGINAANEMQPSSMGKPMAAVPQPGNKETLSTEIQSPSTSKSTGPKPGRKEILSAMATTPPVSSAAGGKPSIVSSAKEAQPLIMRKPTAAALKPAKKNTQTLETFKPLYLPDGKTKLSSLDEQPKGKDIVSPNVKKTNQAGVAKVVATTSPSEPRATGCGGLSRGKKSQPAVSAPEKTQAEVNNNKAGTASSAPPVTFSPSSAAGKKPGFINALAGPGKTPTTAKKKLSAPQTTPKKTQDLGKTPQAKESPSPKGKCAGKPRAASSVPLKRKSSIVAIESPGKRPSIPTKKPSNQKEAPMSSQQSSNIQPKKKASASKNNGGEAFNNTNGLEKNILMQLATGAEKSKGLGAALLQKQTGMKNGGTGGIKSKKKDPRNDDEDIEYNFDTIYGNIGNEHGGGSPLFGNYVDNEKEFFNETVQFADAERAAWNTNEEEDGGAAGFMKAGNGTQRPTDNLVCKNCGAVRAPADDGKVCNACQLYRARTGADRPPIPEQKRQAIALAQLGQAEFQCGVSYSSRALPPKEETKRSRDYKNNSSDEERVSAGNTPIPQAKRARRKTSPLSRPRQMDAPGELNIGMFTSGPPPELVDAPGESSTQRMAMIRAAAGIVKDSPASGSRGYSSVKELLDAMNKDLKDFQRINKTSPENDVLSGIAETMIVLLKNNVCSPILDHHLETEEEIMNSDILDDIKADLIAANLNACLDLGDWRRERV